MRDRILLATVAVAATMLLVSIIHIGGCMWALVTGDTPTARRTKIHYDLNNIHQGTELFRITTGEWPASIEAMMNARHPDTGEPILGDLEELPTDPWGHDYIYEIQGDYPVVTCLGKDHRPGGRGEDTDVVYPETAER